MAFTVEDGTQVAGANSYLTVAYADEYFAERGGGNQDFWSGLSDTDKEQALVRAADYVDKRFGARYIGLRASATQGLRWPRTNAVDPDGFDLEDSVPVPLKQAVCEYAVRAARVVLLPDPTAPFRQTEGSSTVTTNPTGQISRKKVVAGPVESEVEYANSTARLGKSDGLVSEFVMPEYPAADLLLKPLLKRSAQSVVIRG